MPAMHGQVAQSVLHPGQIRAKSELCQLQAQSAPLVDMMELAHRLPHEDDLRYSHLPYLGQLSIMHSRWR